MTLVEKVASERRAEEIEERMEVTRRPGRTVAAAVFETIHEIDIAAREERALAVWNAPSPRIDRR